MTPQETEAFDPFITVAIPTFRRREKLRRAIESVVRQTYANWNLVVSDDEGPGGASWTMVSDYADADPRIRIVENRRGRGQVENTNNVLLSCKGCWIKLLHDDDWLTPDALERFAQAAEICSAAAFLTCCINVVYDDEIKLYAPSTRRPHISIYSSQEALKDLYLSRRTRAIGIVPSTLLIRRTVVQADGLMRTYKSATCGVDQVFFLDLASRGDMGLVREGLVFYNSTNHKNVTSEKSFEEIDLETVDLKNLAWDLLQDRRGLPVPRTVVDALRVIRLRNRIGLQPWQKTLRDACRLLRPSVLKLTIESLVVLMHSEYRDFIFTALPTGSAVSEATDANLIIGRHR